MRKGLTLIELLVVIVILSILTGAVIPLLAPAVESRRIRETARGVSSYLSAARAKAISSNRPVGVIFTPSVGAAGSEASETLLMAEVPPIFAGYAQDASVRLTRVAKSSGSPVFPVQLKARFGYVSADGSFTAENMPGDFIRAGDTMRVNHQGAMYTFAGTAGTYFPTGNNWDIYVDAGTSAVDLPWTPGVESPPMPYQIVRQPQPSSDEPYTLPTGCVIDMNFSGEGTGVFGLAAGEYACIMFSPNGGIEAVYSSAGAKVMPAAPVYVLVGQSEYVPLAMAEKPNWQVGGNFWISVSNSNGQVVTSEVAIDASVTNVAQSRKFAADGRGVGGR